MKKNKDDVLKFVCDTCELTEEELLSRNRTMPLPLVRGFYWFLLKKISGYSNEYIATITAYEGNKYTAAAIGSAIGRIIYSISHEKLWEDRWSEASKFFELVKKRDEVEDITVVVTVPKGNKDKVKINVKERKE